MIVGLRTQLRRAPLGDASGYDAFISYSHALDGALAPALQTGLERFAKPWYRPRALRVFRPESASSGATRLVKWGWVPC